VLIKDYFFNSSSIAVSSSSEENRDLFSMIDLQLGSFIPLTEAQV